MRQVNKGDLVCQRIIAANGLTRRKGPKVGGSGHDDPGKVLWLLPKIWTVHEAAHAMSNQMDLTILLFDLRSKPLTEADNRLGPIEGEKVCIMAGELQL